MPELSIPSPPEGAATAFAALTAFSEAARALELDPLLARACQEIAEGLSVRFAKVLEFLPDEGKLLVRAGVGWADDVVGRTRLDADLGSPAGYALQTGLPTISNDLAAESRFAVPQLLREHAVASAVNVVIRADGFVFGVLEADSRVPRDFDGKEVQFLQGYANVLALVIAQNRVAQEKSDLSRHLAMMLTELHHRTKNNNQMLLGLLELEGRRHGGPVRDVLDEIKARVHVLNELDELIFMSGAEAQIELGAYLVKVMTNALQIDTHHERAPAVQTDVTPIQIDTRRAQAVAMIVNEFVTNSCKYAFSKGADRLGMCLARQDDRVTVTLDDNGPGLPDPVANGIGMRLIHAMAESLDATLDWLPAPGTHLRLSFAVETG